MSLTFLLQNGEIAHRSDGKYDGREWRPFPSDNEEPLRSQSLTYLSPGPSRDFWYLFATLPSPS